MTSFNLNDLFKNPISKYNYFLNYWALGLQDINLGGHSSAHSTWEPLI